MHKVHNAIISRVQEQNRGRFAILLDNSAVKPAQPEENNNIPKFIVAGTAALTIGGAGVFIGGKNYNTLRRLVFDSIEPTKGVIKKVGAYLFNFDKLKDTFFLKTLNKLGAPGRKLIEMTKVTRWFPKKRTESLWKGTAAYADKTKALVAAEAGKQGAHTDVVRLKTLLEDDAFRQVADGFGRRVQNIHTEVRKTVKDFNERYFNPQNGFKHLKEDLMAGEDIVRGSWDNSTAIRLRHNIDDTAQIGEKIRQMEDILKNNGNNLPRRLRKGLNNLITRYKSTANKEIDSFAGRALDLEYGGGITEMLVPPVTGTILAANILRGKDIEEKKENFFKKGGIAFLGGVSTWAVTMMMGVNGPAVLAASFLSGLAFDTIGKIYLKSTKNARTRQKPLDQQG